MSEPEKLQTSSTLSCLLLCGLFPVLIESFRHVPPGMLKSISTEEEEEPRKLIKHDEAIFIKHKFLDLNESETENPYLMVKLSIFEKMAKNYSFL